MFLSYLTDLEFAIWFYPGIFSCRFISSLFYINQRWAMIYVGGFSSYALWVWWSGLSLPCLLLPLTMKVKKWDFPVSWNLVAVESSYDFHSRKIIFIIYFILLCFIFYFKTTKHEKFVTRSTLQYLCFLLFQLIKFIFPWFVFIFLCFYFIMSSENLHRWFMSYNFSHYIYFEMRQKCPKY